MGQESGKACREASAMSFGNRPDPPNPFQVASTQLSYNKQAAEKQQQMNMFNQSGPYGALNYSSDPNSPAGYSASVVLSPEQQAIARNVQQAQNALTSGFAGNYGDVPNFADPNNLMQQQLKLQQAYWGPIFQQQQSNKDAELRNQGIVPGSKAWDNAQNLLARNQGDVTNQFLMGMQPITFQEMLQSYKLPLEIGNQLKGQLPGMPQLVQTPQSTVGAPNYAQAAQNQYQGQQANYASDQQGIMQAIGAGVSLAAAPFTGGASLAALPGMFSGGWGGGGGNVSA